MPQIPVIVELTEEEIAKKNADLSKFYNEHTDLLNEKEKLQKRIKNIKERMNDLGIDIKYGKHTIYCEVEFNKPNPGKKMIYNNDYNYSVVKDMTEEENSRHLPTLFD